MKKLICLVAFTCYVDSQDVGHNWWLLKDFKGVQNTTLFSRLISLVWVLSDIQIVVWANDACGSFGIPDIVLVIEKLETFPQKEKYWHPICTSCWIPRMVRIRALCTIWYQLLYMHTCNLAHIYYRIDKTISYYWLRQSVSRHTHYCATCGLLRILPIIVRPILELEIINPERWTSNVKFESYIWFQDDDHNNNNDDDKRGQP